MGNAGSIVECLVIIGAGNVVAKRILPAVLDLNLAARVVILHNGVCEIEVDHDARVEITDVGDPAMLERFLRKNCAPVLIATPPGPRMKLARQARAHGVLVILEKPLAATRQELESARSLRADSKAFALSYYVQEKALGWTWLCTQSPDLARRLVAGSGDGLLRAAQLVARLGPLRELSIRINEGAERSSHADRPPWYSQVPNGVWLDMGVHVVSLAMLGALRETGRTELDITTVGRLAQADQLHFSGRAGEWVVDATFGKNFPDVAKARWLEARFDNGRFYCDFETGTCTLTHCDGRSETLAPSGGSARYRTMMAQVGEFLASGGWREERHDFIDLQCDALARIFDCLGS